MPYEASKHGNKRHHRQIYNETLAEEAREKGGGSGRERADEIDPPNTKPLKRRRLQSSQ